MKLTAADARRLLLWNQRLTGEWNDAIDVIAHLVAVQTQYSQSLPSVLAARLKGGRFDWIDREIAPGGQLIKSWTVRSTLHTMAVPAFEVLRTSLEEESYKAFLRFCNRAHDDEEHVVAERNNRVLEALAAGPLTRRQLHEMIPEFKAMNWTGWGADVKGLAIQGRVAICSHRGETTFYRREPKCLRMTSREARAEALRMYLRAYGPASKRDFNYWYGGYAGPANQAWADVLPEMEPVELEGMRGLYVLADSPMPKEVPDVGDVRMLAKFDTFVLGHKVKSLYLRPELQGRVFRKAGQVEAAILVHGELAGTWRAKVGGTRVEFTVERWSSRWKASTLKAFEREAAAQARAFGNRDFVLDLVDL